MRQFLTLIVAVLILVTIGCDDRQRSAPSRGSSSASRKPKQPPHTRVLSIPDDVSYSIIDSSTVPGIKRSLQVRLNKRVSEQTLRALALELKSQDVRDYERTFIEYYLTEMKVNEGAWATTHFNPDLEVRILGLTAEEEEALKQQPNDPLREVIGSWIDDTPYLGSRITIFRQDGRLFLEKTYKDGGSRKKEIVKRRSGKGKKFEDKEGNDAGEFYLIDSQGDLQLWDQEGLISTAKRIGG